MNDNLNALVTELTWAYQSLDAVTIGCGAALAGFALLGYAYFKVVLRGD